MAQNPLIFEHKAAYVTLARGDSHEWATSNVSKVI
jgi:hypothetical protein